VTTPITVTVDLRYGAMAGINVFARELWQAELALSDEHDVRLVGLTEQRTPRFTGGRQFPGRTETLRARPFLPAEQLWMPREIARVGAAVHHNPHFNVPYLARVPIVLTVHDLHPLHDPATARSRAAALYYRTLLPAAIRRAAVVVAVAQVTADDIVSSLGVDPRKIRVITHGIDRDRWRPAAAAAVAEARHRHRLPDRYLLYVGAAKRHKNLAAILEAHRPELPTIVFVGCSRAEVAEHADPDDCRGALQFTGAIANDELPAVYTGAVATLLPSLFESVGLPVWESMACGTPVIASNAGGLPVTAGSAALLVDPRDIAGWADAMTRISTDAELRSTLSRAGLERTAALSWTDAARRYLQLYRELGVQSAG
jgi:glycosyltransferase involved in cell wall biosynthesis